jgi:CubicO group peptidase (beta-lactamase class C family)
LRSLALLIAGLFASTASAQVSTGYIEAKRRVTDVRLEAAISNWLEQTSVPGIVLAVVQDSELLALQGRGVKDLESNAEMDPSETVLWAGELVRMFTAAAVLQLRDQGRLDLETDVNVYLTEISLQPEFSPPVSVVTLLTETSGLDARLTGTMARDAAQLLPLDEYLKQRLPPRVRPSALISTASSHGFALAGQVVEEISSEPFDTYLQSHLLGPAGMRQTAVRASADLEARRATGHRFANGRVVIQQLDYPQSGPGFSLWTTAEDMGRWLKMLLADGTVGPLQLLEPSSVRLLLSEQFSNHSGLEGRSLGMRTGSFGGLKTVFLKAISNGFSATLLLVPSLELGVFIACNAEISLDGPLQELLRLFVGPASTEVPSMNGNDRVELSRLQGWYRNTSSSQSSPEKLLSLFQQQRIATGASNTLTWRQQELTHLGGLGFWRKSSASRVAFLQPGDGHTYLATDTEVLERLGWFDLWPIQAGLWWLFASSLLATAWCQVPIAPSRSGLDGAGSSAPRWPFLLARLAALIYCLFFVGLGYWLATTIIAGPESLLFGEPRYVSLLLDLPRIAFLISVLVIASLPVAWVRGHWGPRLRWRFTWVALILLSIVPFLRYWKLLGFQN